MIDYGFEYTPFGVTPDPRMVFRHRQFENAYAALDNGIRAGKGFLVISGDVGAGKTTLLRSYLAAEHPELRTAVILNTGLDPDGLLRAVAEDLDITVAADASRKTVIDLLRDHLLETFSSGKQTAVFIDEAQHLSPEALELLRMLSNLETENEKLIQIILFGQDPLREILSRPDMVQLRSRIAIYQHLKPLELEETREYVAHRIAAAGATVPVAFSESAIKALHRAAEGIPRIINILADGALHAAAEDNRKVVEARHVKAAVAIFADLEFSPARTPGEIRRNFLTVASWIVLIAVLAVLVIRVTRRSEQISPRVETHPVIATATPTSSEGAALLTFFQAYRITPGYTTTQFETLRPEAVARNHNMRWIDLPSSPDLIAAIGLPALARLQGPDGQEPIIIHVSADRSKFRVVRATSEEEIAPALLALDETISPAILLPLSTPERLLHVGTMGEDVLRLQNALFRAGLFRGVVNGVYGPTTVKAVRDFQIAERLPVDGIAGPWTLGTLVRRGDWE